MSVAPSVDNLHKNIYMNKKSIDKPSKNMLNRISPEPPKKDESLPELSPLVPIAPNRRKSSVKPPVT